MKLNPRDAADVLKTFIQEHRTEARIYRSRVQNVSYALAVASFAISAFLIGNVHMGATQLRYVTLLVDSGLVVVMFIFWGVIRPDLVLLRKAMKARQDLLYGLREGERQDIDPFLPVADKKPDIKDSDLYWVVGLSAAVVVVKMLVVSTRAAYFVITKGNP